ncbi:MAG: hypothetical protein ABIP55_10800, partial [Tepidisphaeraceae bacterium]
MTGEKRGRRLRRIAAVVSALVLMGTFVWYRGRAANPDLVISSSKSLVVSNPRTAPQTAPTSQPATTQAAGGFKLNNSIGPDFAVMSDSKVGVV